MSRAVYRVSRTGLERLHFEARIVPNATANVLTMRESYGPARGFPSGISNLTVEGPEARLAMEPGKLLVVSSAPFTLSYDCDLPKYADAISLLRGFRRGNALFSLGMALFHRLHDQTTEYEVNIEAATVSSLSADKTMLLTSDDGARRSTSEYERTPHPMIVPRRRTSASGTASTRRLGRACSGHLFCGNATDLERAYFALGDVVVRAADRTIFVHEPNFPFAVDDLIERWPPLLREVAIIFGDDRSMPWTVFLFASNEHLPGQPGAGFSLHRGALVSVSTSDEVLASPHTLWLLLHEWTHQWLGEAIARADTADDWFFEGFTNFTACEALMRAGLLSGSSLVRLLSLSGRAVSQAKSSGEQALAHQGFLCAQRWNGLLARQGGTLGNVLARLVASHRGKTLQGDVLLSALAQASPDGKVPDFLIRLAAESKSSISAD